MCDDINKGIIDRFRSLPMARSAVLTGRTSSDVVYNAGILRRADGHRASRSAGPSTTGSSSSSPASRLLLLFAFAMAWVGVWLGLSVPTVEVAQQVSFAFIFPITFVSNVFVPLAEHADLAPAVRRVEPDQHLDRLAADACGATRNPFKGKVLASTDPILVTLVWFAILLAIFAPVGVRRYRNMSR